ncbi:MULTISPECIES: pyridoxal 5'-phosphate synthase glutaminase subunit PdxT [Micrococcaceae]|uniref:pyridoxal 5'-phosphate synthase glutaminase subunit PdxT n=1 Tax=Micrococcaceae TaxID=1268 RepID=UPI001608A2E2|nr:MULTISPECIES: pyridoxal 5'-phosphate synthase glutaminase subunit PdxT [Micrococcaceae]MBB5750210.1 5'-phosphate synthase pdxT subunit [Micrococcus sp. TA1]HRO29843.1 pyridoxal 5'-phosphate synthase glutaminase subunit PdxT [Citricoccus sp.]HRO93745.1 pyridoxal 5'-phosphate synthase glutaminase subunit PdxT [Citricoccus sp.]
MTHVTGASRPQDVPAGRAPAIGVFALQGDVREHERVLTALGAHTSPVRGAGDLAGLDGLVIPGGESSVMDKLSRLLGLAPAVRAAIDDGLPVYGTCAGMIMLADRIANPIAGQQSLGGLDITVQRNAFGSQVDSFEARLSAPAVSAEPVDAVFIRAPAVLQAGPGVEVLASVPSERLESGVDCGLVTGSVPVAVRQGNLLATSFHPEVTGDWSFHRYFLDRVVRREP